MNETLHHRGPDGDGEYFSRHVALGHRRLSIIDIEGGDQPIYNEDKSIAIVFNGEIYNFVELREQLLKAGHQFTTQSDTEVIIHLYEEEGIDCLHKLNGMFAFAIWDNNKQRLFIGRDRLGEKPLYYTYTNNELLFSSELKAILHTGQVSKDIDHQAIDDYLAYGYIPAPRSAFRDIRKLPAAHYMLLEDNEVKIERYWQAEMASKVNSCSEQEATEHLGSLLQDSLKMRLRSDVPVGAFLSGGIDSSLIVSLAAEQSSQQLNTFSVGFSEKDYDELSYAKIIANRYGTKHHEIMLTDIDPGLFPRIVSQFDEPFADPSALPTYYVTKEASSHLKVVLSGDGGDELFCGYRRYQQPRIEKLSTKIPSSLKKLLLEPASNILPDYSPGKGLLRRLACDDAVLWQRILGIFDHSERLSLWKKEYRHHIDTSAWLFAPYFKDNSLNTTSRRMIADQNTYMTDDILVKVDRNSMWNSLEVRVPFLDHRIVEYANSLPLDYKFKNGSLKAPLKSLLKGRVPDDLLSRPKSGFAMPIKHWLKDQFYSYSRDLLLSNNARCTEFLDKSSIERLINDNQKGKRDLSRRIWSLLWLEQWLRNLAQI